MIQPRFLLFMIALLFVQSFGWLLSQDASAALPDNCRVVLVLDKAFWRYANPERTGTVTLTLERRDATWQPVFHAEAQYGLNVGHDGYVVKSSSDNDSESLLVRVHIRRDRWMDIVGEGAFDISFSVDDTRCSGSWTGVMHGKGIEGLLAGQIKPLHLVSDFVPPQPGEHPRLLIRRQDLDALREKAATDWGQARLAELKTDPDPTAQAFVYALTGDTQCVTKVRASIQRGIDSLGWYCTGGAQHDPAFQALRQLIAFDLVHDELDEAFRKVVYDEVQDKLDLMYWGCFNTQFNGSARSNWSLMFRSAAGLLALTALDLPLESTDKPAREELLHVTPPANLVIGKEVPVVTQSNEQPINAWLFAGPFDESFDNDALKDSGGMAQARPEAGTPIGDKTFRRLADDNDKAADEIRKGAVNLRKLNGYSCRKGNYLYCVLDVPEGGYYKIDSNHNPKGVRRRTFFLNGNRLDAYEYVQLDAGRYPLLVRVWTDPVGGWEAHVFWCRLVKVDKDEAMAWHLPRAAGAKADAFCGTNWREIVEAKTPWNLDALRYLRQAQHEAEGYFTGGLGDFGWNQEGEAYTRHAMRLGIPFALCYRNVMGMDMDGADRLGLNMALCTATTIFSDDGARMQSFNVGGGPMDVDLYSRAFCLVPQPFKPAVLWAWNRSLALAEAGKLKDPHGVIATNAGLSAVMRFINTPLDMDEVNPAECMDRVTVDHQKGGYVFRNRWRDGDDCVVQLFANDTLLGGSWTSQEGGTFRIDGLGYSWVVRGQSYGNGASSRAGKNPDYSQYQSMVDVREHRLGYAEAKTTFFQRATDGSGIVAFNMDDIYKHAAEREGGCVDIGIRATRSLAVDYSGTSGSPCLVAVADRLTGTKGDNTWQLPLPREMDVTIDGNTFLVTAPTGETLSGTVVQPKGAGISTEDFEHTHEINYHGNHSQAVFLRRGVFVKGTDVDQNFFVVMTLQRGEAPACRETDESVTMGKQSVSFDGKRLHLGHFAPIGSGADK